MTPYLKSIYLNVGWQGEVNSVPETFHMDMTKAYEKNTSVSACEKTG